MRGIYGINPPLGHNPTALLRSEGGFRGQAWLKEVRWHGRLSLKATACLRHPSPHHRLRNMEPVHYRLKLLTWEPTQLFFFSSYTCHHSQQRLAAPRPQPPYLLSSIYAKDRKEVFPAVRFTPETPRCRHGVGVLKGSPEFPRFGTGGKIHS